MDDAAVVHPAPGSGSLVLTIDVITPIVDDPRTFGAIAACNSVSDVYAMGGAPQVALTFVGWPTDKLSLEALGEVLQGVRDVCARARCAVVGGHTIADAEPKCGLAVVGTVDPARIWSHAAARAGDVLVLTKPLGVGIVGHAIKAGEATLMIAGGVESMSRAPFVMPKAESAFSRANAVYDTTIGWRFINKLMKDKYGVDSMPETAENVAVDFNIEREAQDLMALNSQLRAVAAIEAGHLAREICAVTIPQKKGDAIVVDTDEHPRKTSLEALAKLKGVVRTDGTVTAGNASGVNDGACALILADEATAARNGLTPKARVVGMATAGVAPRIMGIGPAPATQKVLAQTGLTLAQMDVIELNEAFAAQGLAVLRLLGLQDDDPRVNAWGGAIALGHPLGASGARLATTAINRLHTTGGRYALCTMCIGVGQGIAIVIERV